MQVGVLGISYKTASIEVREVLSQITHALFEERLSSFEDHSGFSFVILNTCNRTEIYFSSDNPTEAQSDLLIVLQELIDTTFEPYLYVYYGVDCFLHLSRVCTGLESAVLAETEIQGQVKKAYERARSLRKLEHALHFAFQKALMIGKKMRSNFSLEMSKPSFEKTFWEELQDHVAEGEEILFVGASQVNLNLLRYGKYWQSPYITHLTNRTEKKGKESLDAIQGILWQDWKCLHSWEKYAAVIVGTAHTGYLLPLKKVLEPKFLVDLSLPRNIDPKIAEVENISLINIDHLHQKVTQSSCIHKFKARKVAEIVRKEVLHKHGIFSRKVMLTSTPQISQAMH